MNIVGITGGMHSCGLAYTENGEPKFAFEEERFNRIKCYNDAYNFYFRFPFLSGQNVKHSDTFDWNKLDYIASVENLKDTKTIWYGINLGPFPEEKYVYVNHHEAHCGLAYYCSGFEEDTLVLSVDASGEKYSSRSYLGKKGNLIEVSNIPLTQKSLGHYYAMLTEFLGFKRLKDEGKVVGMSSHGVFNQEIYDCFDKCITIKGFQTDKDKGKKFLGGVYEDFYKLWFEEYGSRMTFPFKEDIAYNGQLVFEDKILQLLENYHESFPEIKKLALAGGIFANVKLNKRINELDWIDEVFIAPPMGDEGLPLGACLVAHSKKTTNFKPFKLKDVFLGIGIKNFEYDKSKFLERPYNRDEIAHDLKDGKIIGWFNGRHEYGPRALCNRSIIADPSIPGTYKRINDKLQRNDKMPFAPVVIDNYADKVFKVDKSKYTAEFMTMLYDTHEEWVDKIPAVVHPIDKTARIQIVTAESNHKFYQLINKFNELTGIPVLLNTSFNVHGEPIVCHPEEAFVHLSNKVVDKLVINHKIYTNK
jgi:carbamoyltransferase